MDPQIKKTIKFYDDFAKQYTEYAFPKLLQYQLNQFISFLNGKKVLDAGCGAGRDVTYFMEEGLEVIGIDTSKGMLREARKRVKNGKFRLMDMTKLKLKDNAFDGIWCCASLLHLRKKDVKNALSEFRRVMKKGGVLYISVKEGEGEKVLDSGFFIKGPRFYSFFKQTEIEQLLEEAGFDILISYPEKDDVVWLNIFARAKEQ